MNNQLCKVRPQIVNVNGNDPVFFSFSIKASKCSGSCGNINNPYTKLCVPDVAKNLNVKVLTLMSRTNETCKCKCKCRLDASVCNNKQRWNDDKCWCECTELIDKGVCDKGFTWNPSNYGCECYKSCDFSEYLDYENCKGRNKLADKLVEECTETVEEVKLAKVTSAEHEISINTVLARCTLFYFQYFLQLTLELIAIFFVFTGT